MKYFVVCMHQGTNTCVNKATLATSFRGQWWFAAAWEKRRKEKQMKIMKAWKKKN